MKELKVGDFTFSLLRQRIIIYKIILTIWKIEILRKMVNEQC